MLVAVMSDSHDNIWNLRKALGIIKDEKAGMIIHCGDFVAPFMLTELNAAGIPVHGVFGNNDGDQYLLTKFSLTTLTNVTLHGLVGQVAPDGFRLAFTHQEVVARGLASSDDFGMVFFGHSHQYLQEKIGQTALLNPGEVMGKDGSPGFCLVDTETTRITKIEIN
ncbi:MAG: YfcE family phosphodiesterase [Proteobacteria bacterium]|nr:YfcE family phosphodiesterase [Pseudomonadota bacterium]